MAFIDLRSSPVDGSVIVERRYPTADELETQIDAAHKAFESYKDTSLDERIAIAERFLEEIEKRREQLAIDVAEQMGRPLFGGSVEVDGTIARGKHMISIARGALADVTNKVRFQSEPPLRLADSCRTLTNLTISASSNACPSAPFSLFPHGIGLTSAK